MDNGTKLLISRGIYRFETYTKGQINRKHDNCLFILKSCIHHKLLFSFNTLDILENTPSSSPSLLPLLRKHSIQNKIAAAVIRSSSAVYHALSCASRSSISLSSCLFLALVASPIVAVPAEGALAIWGENYESHLFSCWPVGARKDFAKQTMLDFSKKTYRKVGPKVVLSKCKPTNLWTNFSRGLTSKKSSSRCVIYMNVFRTFYPGSEDT